MKKFGLLLVPVLACGLFASACGEKEYSPAPTVVEEKAPAPVSPLAVLDTVEIDSAFGDRTAADWSFALQAEGEIAASYSFLLNSELTDSEKLNLIFGGAVNVGDLLGIRSAEEEGVGLFGGGNVGLALSYRGPHADDEPLTKDYTVGFRHDGDLVWYAGEGDKKESISLSKLQEKVRSLAALETFERVETAFSTIPEELQKGVSLRLAVEKLIDLGFSVNIDETDGIAVTLQASEAFYTDLLNDMLERFIPAEWLQYLPRADFRFEKTAFRILLSFDKDGMFKEYSMSSDLSLASVLTVRGLFSSTSAIGMSGSFAIRAYDGEIPSEEELPSTGEEIPAA